MSATVVETFNLIRDEAEKIKNDETQTVGTVSKGDVIRQGDLYLVQIEKPKMLRKTKERQLAPGNTQGSRHVVQGKCEIWECEPASVIEQILAAVPGVELHAELIGPVICPKGEIEIDHPEHANVKLPNEGFYAVVYQRAFANEIRRQLD